MVRRTPRERILQLAQHKGFVGAGEIASLGIHTQLLSRLVSDGTLERVARGCYRPADGVVSEHHCVAPAAAAVPKGVLCLISALGFHGIGTQLPAEIWLAIDRKSRRPALRYPPLRVVRFTGRALTSGVEIHKLDGQRVRVFGVAKTLADCFKYRNKIGLDVALEALRECRRDQRASSDELWHHAKICRVANVMRPYLESIQ